MTTIHSDIIGQVTAYACDQEDTITKLKEDYITLYKQFKREKAIVNELRQTLETQKYEIIALKKKQKKSRLLFWL